MQSQDKLNTRDAVGTSESMAFSDPETEEGDIGVEEGGTDDSTYETEEEPTTEAESDDDDKDLDKSQYKRLVRPVIQSTFESSQLEILLSKIHIFSYFFIIGSQQRTQIYEQNPNTSCSCLSCCCSLVSVIDARPIIRW